MDKDSERTSTVVQYIEDVGAMLSVPPNTAYSVSMLSPQAAAFQPCVAYPGRGQTLGQQLAELHLSSSLAITALKLKALELERRRLTDAGLIRSRRQSLLAKIVEGPAIRHGPTLHRSEARTKLQREESPRPAGRTLYDMG
jgi:hypothetical protein